MEIFEATAYDAKYLDALNRLIPQMAPDAARITRERLEAIIGSGNSAIFFASVDGEIVGTATLGHYDIPVARKAWIEDVVVDSGSRGLGIGKALVLRLLDHAGSVGADTVMLTSSPAREAANAMYLSIGFAAKTTNVYVYRLPERG